MSTYAEESTASKNKASIDIEGNGVFLSYQMLFLLISGLISLGITISVWNSYQSDIQNNTNELSRLEKMINEKYILLDSRIEQRHDDVLQKMDEKYNIIERRVDKNNERYKDWIKSNSKKTEDNKENILKLKYSKIDKK